MSAPQAMARFFAPLAMSDADYAALPPLVQKGQDSDTVLENVVNGWLERSDVGGTGRDAIEAHVAKGGHVLSRVALFDGNTDMSIDLGKLLKIVERRLTEDHGEPKAFRSRPDLFILLHGCRVDECRAEGVNVRPCFVAFQTKFGDSTDFSLANFGDGANFIRAVFGERTKFWRTNFGDGADMRQTRYGRHSVFRQTRFTNADLRGVVGFVPDETFIQGAQFSAFPRDPWSKLRSAYTGPRLIFNLLFLSLFFLPLIARTAGYYAGGQAQEHALEVLEAMDQRLIAQHDAHPELSAFTREQIKALRTNLPKGENGRWRPSQVWKAVFGVDKGPKFWVAALLLLVYNLGRGGLTYIIAPMRDAEERSNITPALRPKSREEVRTSYYRERGMNAAEVVRSLPDVARHVVIAFIMIGAYGRTYGWLLWPYRTLTILLWLAIVSFTWGAWKWLTMPLWLPAPAS